MLLAFAAAWELAGGAGERIGAGARGALLDGSPAAAPARSARPPSGSGCRSGSSAPGSPAGSSRARSSPRSSPARASAALVAIAAVPVVPARLGVVGRRGAGGRRLPRPRRAARARRAPAPGALRRRAARTRSTCSRSARPRVATRRPGSARSPTGTSGPLAAELGRAVAEIECGRPLRDAIEELRERVPGAEVGALAAALERSRTYGSPLAEQLHLQATALRRDARRRIEERAARAAPKIQLVVALVLVPSVLLMIVAAIVAHSDALLGQF